MIDEIAKHDNVLINELDNAESILNFGINNSSSNASINLTNESIAQ